MQLVNETNFEKLTNDFCKEIIQHYFLTEPEIDEIYPFVINFLLFKKEEENYKFVFKIVSDFKTKYWYDFKPSTTKKINNFIKAFVVVANEKDIELEVLETFMKNFETVFLPYETIDEYLLIKFVLLWKKSPYNLESFASQVVQYLENIGNEYNDILRTYANAFSVFLDFIDEKAKLNLMLCIMQTPNLILASNLVIELLRVKHDFVWDDRIRTKYLKVDTALKQTLHNNQVNLQYNLLLSEF